MTSEEFRERAFQHELGHHIEALLSTSKRCVRLLLSKQNDSEIPVGASKMGGDPDLPSSISWPYEDQRPLSPRDRAFGRTEPPKERLPLLFIAQLNLGEVAPLDLNSYLPDRGMLYFFYSDEQPWGFDPQDKYGFRVFFFSGGTTELERRLLPDASFQEGKFDSASITFRSEISLPTHPEIDGLTENEIDRYYDLTDEFPINKMFGYPDLIQDEMEIECEMVTQGHYMGDYVPPGDQRLAAAKIRSKDWLLLLQVDSNEDDCGMMWGDLGRVYYWIRKDDLARREFDRTWLILQCS